MTLPLWWSRTSCVYCGCRILGGVYGQRVRVVPSALACWRHVKLVPLDPFYAESAREGTVSR